MSSPWGYLRNDPITHLFCQNLADELGNGVHKADIELLLRIPGSSRNVLWKLYNRECIRWPTHVVENVHDLHFARNGLETLDQLPLNQLLDDSVDRLLHSQFPRRTYRMQASSHLDLSNPNALVSSSLNALVHEHFRVSQVIQLRLLGNLIVRRQAKHVAVRALQNL